MKIENNRFASSIHFDSILELMNEIKTYNGLNEDYLGDILNDDLRYYPAKSLNKFNVQGWFGKENHKPKDVINHALLGHENLLNRLSELTKNFNESDMDSYSQTIKARKRKRAKGEFGDELDIHQVNLGNFDKCFSYRKHIEVEKRIHLITLMIDVGGMYRDNVNDSLWRAAVALKITDQLIKAGKSVKIIIGSSCKNLYYSDQRIHTTTITVKNYNEPLSLERLAAMSHLGFHRVFNFAARTMFNKPRLNRAMGSSVDWLMHNHPVTMQNEIDAGHTKYVYIHRSQSFNDAQKSINDVYKQLKEFNKSQ